MAGAPLVSVVVAARNAEAEIAGLLDDLAAQSLDHDSFEAIVVDDASTDATADVAAAHGAARLVRRERRGGSYAARNSGLEAARGAVIAITDADCRPARDWLERGLAELDAMGVDLLGGRVDVPLGPRAGLVEALDAARFLNQRRAVRELGFAVTANLFVRRKVFEAVGGFDERFLSGGDAELCDRAIRAGFELAYSPAPVVSHTARTQARAVLRKSFRIGFGVGQMRRLGSGPARDARPAWSTLRSFRRRHWFFGADRLEAAGYALHRRRRLALEGAQYVLVQLPMIAGQVAADIRRGRGR